MPESRLRRKKAFTPPTTPRNQDPVKIGNPSWWAPVMVAFFVLGLFWIVVYYIVGNELPLMKSLGWFNILIGFGLIGVGFGMSTRWR